MATLLCGSALITGAGSGIGQYTAYALAQHGIRKLAICDINTSSLETTSAQLQKSHHDLEVLPLEIDVSNETSVQSAFRKTIDRFNRLDVTVNNAGIGGPSTPTHETELSKWDRVIDVNLKGVWLCQREAIRYMLKQQALETGPRGSRGVIVNVASMLGTVASSPNTPACAYTSAKHAVMGKLTLNHHCQPRSANVQRRYDQNRRSDVRTPRHSHQRHLPRVRGNTLAASRYRNSHVGGRDSESASAAVGRDGGDCRCDYFPCESYVEFHGWCGNGC